jgi:hypothetical protein
MTRKQAPPLVYPDAPQRDHVAEHITTCPTCGGPWKAAKRVCRRCGQPIGRNDKWQTVPVGPGTFAYEHREPCGVAAPAIDAPSREHTCRGCGHIVTHTEWTTMKFALPCSRCGGNSFALTSDLLKERDGQHGQG